MAAQAKPMSTNSAYTSGEKVCTVPASAKHAVSTHTPSRIIFLRPTFDDSMPTGI